VHRTRPREVALKCSSDDGGRANKQGKSFCFDPEGGFKEELTGVPHPVTNTQTRSSRSVKTPMDYVLSIRKSNHTDTFDFEKGVDIALRAAQIK